MIFTQTKRLSKTLKLQILELWNREYPKRLSLSGLAGFEKYLQGLSGKHHIILTDENGKLKGWLIYFTRDNEPWFAMLLDPSVQGQGLGSKLLELAKKYNPVLNGWVIDNDKELKQNGEHYFSPIGFYKKNGFQIIYDKKIIKEGIGGIKVSWKNNPSIHKSL